MLSDLELILQYLVFLCIPNDHSAPGIVRWKASKLHNVLKAGTYDPISLILRTTKVSEERSKVQKAVLLG